MRELREEVGYTGEVRCIDYLGEMRFGFLTPQKNSRLKVQHVSISSDGLWRCFHTIAL